jgi:predicted PhzF superfamily epimerase YddE/YHI9
VTDVYVLHVFTDEQGNFGDIATVIFDEGRGIPDDTRQEIARDLDAVETAFVNDAAAHQVSFVRGQREIDFAGVPAVGVAWLLGQREGRPISQLEGRGGEITVTQESGLTWVRASLSTMPPWKHVQYPDADSVDRISLPETADWEHTMVWAWINENEGYIRARTFAADWDIPEAMGNGSGSMLLASLLGRVIEIRHGEGSVIHARPADDGSADIGGRVSESSPIVV